MFPSRSPGRLRALVAAAVAAVTVAATAAVVGLPGSATAADPLLSQGKPTTASSVEGAAWAAPNATDGNTGTRWASERSDPQWLQVDLGTTATVSQVVLNWEAAYGRAFEIQVADSATGPWARIYSTTTGTGGTQTLAVSGTGRYVRMYGTARGTGYGYSLWEFQVYGTTGGGGGTPSPTPTGTGGPALPGGGDLGANVHVYDPSQGTAAIQASVDAVFAAQEKAQFGTRRDALFFKPGRYDINVNVGFNTSVHGLGRNPGDVVIGGLTVDAGWFGGNATQNFWRSVENFSVPGSARWAVSQATSMRRVQIGGGLNLAPTGYGWASGGYIADSRITGELGQYSQQQWLTRNSSIGSSSNAVWNQMFVGTEGAPANSFPNPAYTTIDRTPVIREKPYLYLDGANNYQVLAPELRRDSRGASWAGGATPGTSIPLSQFYVAKPSDSAATINRAAAQGLNLLFTPGIYRVDQTIDVTRADTVVLGLGYATLEPVNGVVPMRVADVDGVKIAGLLFDAGTVNSPVLLEVGPTGSSAGHAANPTTIQDVFFRIGGRIAGKATTSLVVNSNNAIVDHIWAWRADHGDGVGWTVNTADQGLIVNGQNVTAYGLFVEHYQKYDVVWNGNGGRTYFFQNEKAYDPPSQAAWRTGANGYAAYKVADTVTTHEAWGLGSYVVFTTDASIHVDRAFEVPVTAGVRMHNLSTVSLGGKGVVDHVINNTGAATSTAQTVPSTVVNFP